MTKPAGQTASDAGQGNAQMVTDLVYTESCHRINEAGCRLGTKPSTPTPVPGGSKAAGLAHLLSMTVSMRVMSAGDGCKYLLRTVAAGDGDRSLASPLTRYYGEAGTPPGRWLGSGVTALGHGELTSGAQDRCVSRAA